MVYAFTLHVGGNIIGFALAVGMFVCDATHSLITSSFFNSLPLHVLSTKNGAERYSHNNGKYFHFKGINSVECFRL